MNDVVFAVHYAEFGGEAAKKYNKCLKIFLPIKGRGASVLLPNAKNGGESLFIGAGEYAVIPPYAEYAVERADGEELIVCIEQPMMPLSLPVKAVKPARSGMRNAAEEAVYYFSEEPKDAAVLSALGELMLSYALREYSLFTHPAVKQLKADIERNMTDSAYSVETAIRKLPLNYDYVRKLFKKETGISPREYLLSVRMERARSIILSGISNNYSNFTVSQTAEACGFAEPLYFSRVFKKYFGLSPLRYAEENGKGESVEN